MVTKAVYEASYRAAVELGDPLAPKTLHAVLEAAEGARGVVVEARAPDQNSIEVARSRAAHQSELKARKGLVDAATALRPALDGLMRQATQERSHYYVASVVRSCLALLDQIDLLSSDARPAPMAEEVKDALEMVRFYLATDSGKDAADTLAAHIDDLTRKVAEAAAWRAEAEGSLVEAGKALGYMSERAEKAEAVVRDARQLLITLQFARPAGTKDPIWDELTAFLAHPSPGPATETDRKDGWWVTPEWRGNLLYAGPAYLGMVGGNGHDGFAYWLHGVKGGDFSTREDAQAVLLASVRPKAEGV